MIKLISTETYLLMPKGMIKNLFIFCYPGTNLKILNHVVFTSDPWVTAVKGYCSNFSLTFWQNYCYLSNFWKLLLYCITAENFGSSNFAVTFLKLPTFLHGIQNFSRYFCFMICFFLRFPISFYRNINFQIILIQC